MKTLFKDNLTIEDYARLIEAWEIHRGAEGAEDVFDLEDKKDRALFMNLHGRRRTRLYRKAGRFWFSGMNFEHPAPFPRTEEEAWKLAENLIEERYITERPDIYEEFLK